MSKFTLEDLLKEVNIQTKVAVETEAGASVDSSREVGLGKSPAEATIGKEINKEKDIDLKEVEERSMGKSVNSASPVDEAIQMAGKLAAMEKETLMKEAYVIGQAIIDGAIARTQEYEKVAMSLAPTSHINQKVAAAQGQDDNFKLAFQVGYTEKVAEMKDSFNEGFVRTVASYHPDFQRGFQQKVASTVEFNDSYSQGFMDKIAEEIEKDPAAKRAFVEGYEKTAAEFTKKAELLEKKGYVEAANAISKLISK